jgi:hypothetical protein
MRRGLFAAALLLAAPGVAHAHFALVEPPAFSEQDNSGLPEKSAPCGQADPDTPMVPTGAVTTFEAGETITITIDEKIFHPGHYRVALGDDMASLPAEPTVMYDAAQNCGSAEIQARDGAVLLDGALPHEAAFAAPQSFQVTLPDRTCTGCTLQVIQFMAGHSQNVPGGCFYHHCATITIAPRMEGDGDASGGCSSSGGGGIVFAGLLVLPLAARRRTLTRCSPRSRSTTSTSS